MIILQLSLFVNNNTYLWRDLARVLCFSPYAALFMLTAFTQPLLCLLLISFLYKKKLYKPARPTGFNKHIYIEFSLYFNTASRERHVSVGIRTSGAAPQASTLAKSYLGSLRICLFWCSTYLTFWEKRLFYEVKKVSQNYRTYIYLQAFFHPFFTILVFLFVYWMLTFDKQHSCPGYKTEVPCCSTTLYN